MSRAKVTSISKGPTTNNDVEGEAIKNLARTIPEGGELTWEDMSRLINRPKDKVRRVWHTARSDLISEGIVFKSMFGIGYRRCSPEQTVEKVGGRMQTIRRTANAASRENRTVDRKRLDPSMAAHADTQAVILLAIESKMDEPKIHKVAPSSAPDIPLAALASDLAKLK